MGATTKTKPKMSEETKALRKQHREWKREAAAKLHRFADRSSWCSEFETRVMKPLGLPPRPDHAYGMRTFRLKGENTVEEFEAWKLKAGALLYGLAVRYNILEEYGQAILEAGFTEGRPRTVTVRTTGTFTFDHTVTVAGDAKIEDDPDVQRMLRPESWQIRSYIRNNLDVDNNLTYQAVLVED